MCLDGLCNKMIDDTRIVSSQTVWEWKFGVKPGSGQNHEEPIRGENEGIEILNTFVS